MKVVKPTKRIQELANDDPKLEAMVSAICKTLGETLKPAKTVAEFHKDGETWEEEISGEATGDMLIHKREKWENDRSPWYVSHLPTGAKMVGGFNTKTEARIAAARLDKFSHEIKSKISHDTSEELKNVFVSLKYCKGSLSGVMSNWEIDAQLWI